MKSTGIIRPIDRMGRVVIPKEIRRHLHVENDIDSFEIYTEGEYVVLKKYQPTCVFCGNLGESVEMSGHTVCNKCIEKLRQKMEEEKAE